MDDANIAKLPKEEHNHTNEVVDVVADVIETVVDNAEVVNLGCQIASCLDGVSDCGVLDCGVLDCASGCL
jgi:hypothetical protein